MSATALQRVLVRMLYDPALVDAIYGGADPVEITAEEAAMLRATPRAAWTTDPLRRSRTLHALLDEYPASAAVAGLGRLDAFFASPPFHRAMQERQHLALAFGSWLLPLAGPIARLERAIAEARRDRDKKLTDGQISSAPGLRALRVPSGSVARLEQIRAGLGLNPLATLLRPGARPVPLGPLGPDESWVLVERAADGGMGLGDCTDALGRLLEAAQTPRSRAELLTIALQLGADPGEEAEIVNGLLAEGLVVCGGDGAAS